MNKVLVACAAALLAVAAGVDSADARTRGGGMGGGVRATAVHHGGGRVHIGGGTRAVRFAAPAHRFTGHRVVGHRFAGHRVVRTGRVIAAPRFAHHRRFVRRGVVVRVGYPYVAYRGCYRWRWVATPFGWQWRRVNVCRLPYRAYHRIGFPYRLYY